MSPAAAETIIHRLDPRLINQIAAGEVIVRPASAVKELVENSMDAGATRIEVAVEEDARGFTVRDDGAGMSAADARLSVERYATSKIREFEDLTRLTTRGFRGEALAAISSVSRFELLTRRAGDDAGTQLRTAGGADLRVTPAGLPTGTTIHVRDLFYNTPVRLKFLKAPMAEWGHILKTILRQALTRPDVGFSIRWKGRPYLDLPSGQSLRDRLAAVLPGGAGDELLDVDHELHGVRVRGCITPPSATRRDRRHQYYFANGRPIESRPLTFALQEAYKGLIMTQQFPLCALFIDLPGDELDVNVHPTKEEVRFRNEALVAGAIHRGALEALRGANLVPRLELPDAPGVRPASASMPGGRIRKGDEPHATPGFFRSGPVVDYGTPAPRPSGGSEAGRTASLRQGSLDPVPRVEVGGREEGEPPRSAEESYPDELAASEAELIGSLRDEAAPPRAIAQIELTYILVDAPGRGMLLIDQHAAHEKILYLKFRAQRRRMDVQELMIPWTYEASPAEVPALEALAPVLTAQGFQTEHFGGTTFVVQSVPLIYEKVDIQALLRDLIDDIGGGNLEAELERIRHRVGAMAACRAAVKAGDPLTLPEMQRITDQVLETRDALRCPHGRPTMLLLTRDQLDRQFGRMG